MIVANRQFVHEALGAWIGAADDDEQWPAWSAINADDENAMRKKIALELVPDFQASPQRYRDRMRDSLRYFLNKEGFNFARVIDSELVPIDVHGNGRQIYVWIWEAYFPGQSIGDFDASEYIEIEDVDEPRNVFAGVAK